MSPAKYKPKKLRLLPRSWNKKEYKYKVVESITLSAEVDELDEYVFVARVRIDKKTTDPTFFVNIKSEALRDILRTVLRDINRICLREDKPTVEVE
ncbi:hypothetical protein ABVK25_012460 [Lepraria finkii]|uniref:Uncharacterized protein n=1 Tax=Lepraria finkii TaxID=1340010 RepID=A0ABR4AKZ5_9LECA